MDYTPGWKKFPRQRQPWMKAITAYYPYLENIECQWEESGYKFTGASLPAELEYTAGSFSPGAFPMMATGDGNDIRFHNICGALKLKFKGSQSIAVIKISGRNNEKLCVDVTNTYIIDEAADIAWHGNKNTKR